MRKVASTTSLWLFGLVVSSAIYISAFAQVPSTANSMAENSSSPTSSAAKMGTAYGASAGEVDAELRLMPRPKKSSLYYIQHKSAPDGYEQQYREAFEKAYRLSYESALNSHKPYKRPAHALGK